MVTFCFLHNSYENKGRKGCQRFVSREIEAIKTFWAVFWLPGHMRNTFFTCFEEGWEFQFLLCSVDIFGCGRGYQTTGSIVALYMVCVLSWILNVVDLWTERRRQFQHLGLQEWTFCLLVSRYLLCRVCWCHSRAIADRQKSKGSVISQIMTLLSLKRNQYKQCQNFKHWVHLEHWELQTIGV